MSSLPSPFERSEFAAFRTRPDAWLPVARDLCRAHGHDGEPVSFGTESANCVAGVGSVVLKLFPPFHRHQWESEHRVLAALSGVSLGVAVPALLAQGEQDGWTYVLTSRLPGRLLEERWSKLAPEARLALLGNIGALMAQVHALPVPPPLRDLPPEWGGFLEMQRRGARSRHQRLGMPSWLLNAVSLDFELPDPHVLLTGEYTPFNLLVDENDALSGMIDFGDAMIGPASYDLLGPLLFLAAGDARQVAALFTGYGRAIPTGPARTQLLQLALLHRYSDLRGQLRVPHWETRASSMVELEGVVFGDFPGELPP